MTTLREAAQQALEALEQCGLDDSHRSYEKESAAKAALRTSLAQQEQEPVAWVDKGSIAWLGEQRSLQRRKVRSRREWQSLTNEELNRIESQARSHDGLNLSFLFLEIQQALKEKNA